MRRIFGVFRAIPAARLAVPFRPSYMTMANFRPMPSPPSLPPMSGFRLMSTNLEDETTEPSDPNERLEYKVDVIRGLLASPDSSKEELLKAQLSFRRLASDLVDEGVWEAYIAVGSRLKQHSIGIDDLLELLYTGTWMLRRSQPRNRGPAQALLSAWMPWLQATLADSELKSQKSAALLAIIMREFDIADKASLATAVEKIKATLPNQDAVGATAVLTALRRLQYQDNAFYVTVADSLAPKVRDLPTVSLAHVVGSVAALNLQHLPLIKALVNTTAERLPEFQIRSLIKTGHAFWLLFQLSSQLRDGFRRELVGRLQAGVTIPRELFFPLAEALFVKSNKPELEALVAQQATRQVDKMQDSHLVGLTRAYSICQHLPRPLFRAVSLTLLPRVPELPAPHAAKLLRSYHRFDAADETFVPALAARLAGVDLKDAEKAAVEWGRAVSSRQIVPYWL